MRVNTGCREWISDVESEYRTSSVFSENYCDTRKMYYEKFVGFYVALPLVMQKVIISSRVGHHDWKSFLLRLMITTNNVKKIHFISQLSCV